MVVEASEKATTTFEVLATNEVENNWKYSIKEALNATLPLILTVA